MNDDIKGFIALVVGVACCYALLWAMAKDGKIAIFRHGWSKTLFAYSVFSVAMVVWMWALDKGIFA